MLLTPRNAFLLVSQGLCLPKIPGDLALADCRPLPPGPTWVGAESSHAALAVLRGALARFACVCVPVRACACAALTCRLLTEVFVCTQASELRGPPALPPLPSEPRPCLRHLSDLAVFHCLLPTDPAGPDPVPASPPLPTHAASWDSP